MKGGLRSSILTDAVQTILFLFLLGFVLFAVLPASGPRVMTAGDFGLGSRIDLLLVALLQSLSYPFHDPVLTDRVFISRERVTVRAFAMAGGVGFRFIVLFGLVGVHAFVQGIPAGEDTPGLVARSFGVATLAGMNVLMLTSAGSTLDSTFSSLAKAGAIDLKRILRSWDRRAGSLGVGRWIMASMAVAGNLPLVTGARILQATTISGTMVMGLAPIFPLAFLKRASTLSFHLAFWPGVAIGVLHVLGLVPPALAIGGGRHGLLLGINLYGLLLCTALFLFPALWADRRKLSRRA